MYHGPNIDFDFMTVFYFCGAGFLIFVLYFALFKAKNSTNVDPIAEADVYMAYGRKAQAIELLEQALAKEPNNLVIENKLNEFKNS